MERDAVVSEPEAAPADAPMYPTDFISLTDLGGIVVLVAYIWPLLLGLGRRATRYRWSPRLLPFVEALLCLGSGCVIFQLGSWGRPMVGWYVGLGAVAILFLATVPDCWAILSGSSKGKSNRGPAGGRR